MSLPKAQFDSFSQELRNIQVADSNTPMDYLETRVAVMAKYAGLGNMAVGAGQKLMGAGSRVGQFIGRNKDVIGHGAEVAGLGVLAAPSISEVRNPNTPPNDRKKSKAELAGLGILAAHPAASLISHAAPKIMSHFR